MRDRARHSAGLVRVRCYRRAPRRDQADRLDQGKHLGALVGPGSGTVLKFSAPLTVSCRAVGRPTTNRVVIDGSCSVSIISVRIGADITYDPQADRYTGTYIGAKVGPADVVGKRSGSTVNLSITWPKPVNGDTNARMTIENAGKGSLHLTIFDNLVPGGPEKKTTDVTLSWGLK